MDLILSLFLTLNDFFSWYIWFRVTNIPQTKPVLHTETLTPPTTLCTYWERTCTGIRLVFNTK